MFQKEGRNFDSDSYELGAGDFSVSRYPKGGERQACEESCGY